MQNNMTNSIHIFCKMIYYVYFLLLFQHELNYLRESDFIQIKWKLNKGKNFSNKWGICRLNSRVMLYNSVKIADSPCLPCPRSGLLSALPLLTRSQTWGNIKIPKTFHWIIWACTIASTDPSILRNPAFIHHFTIFLIKTISYRE